MSINIPKTATAKRLNKVAEGKDHIDFLTRAVLVRVFIPFCIEVLERGNMNQAVLNAKQKMVSEIAGKVRESASTVVVEYRGLTVAEVTELRRNLRAENVEFKVYKNTMVERAMEECGYSELKETLKGPNAIAFSSDATAPARVLAKFAKKHKMLVLKNGIVEGKVVDTNTINELASLPNRDGMLSMLLSCLQAPVASFARVVKAVADAKEDGTLVVNETTKEEVVAEEAPVAEETVTEAPAEEVAPATEETPAE